MKHITFKSIDELVKYLTDNHFGETKFFVTPDYIKSIFGITDNGILLYSYTDMVEELYLEYTENDKIEDLSSSVSIPISSINLITSSFLFNKFT